MCDICSNVGFVSCVNCEECNAFCVCNPHFTACSNPDKSTARCTELSAFEATLAVAIEANKLHAYSSRDCALHCMDCQNYPFYGCREQEMDDEDCLAHTHCCENCDSLLLQLQLAEENQDNVNRLADYSKEVLRLKTELETLEEVRKLIEKTQRLTHALCAQSLDVEGLANGSTMDRVEHGTKELAEVVSQLAIIKARSPESFDLKSHESSIRRIQEYLRHYEGEIRHFSHCVESYRATQMHYV